jgi:subtilisin family serine protease
VGIPWTRTTGVQDGLGSRLACTALSPACSVQPPPLLRQAATGRSYSLSNGRAHSFEQRGADATRQALDLVRLTPLLGHTAGSADIRIGLIDGPISTRHFGLANANIREVPGSLKGTCARASSAACQHGTFLAGMLVAHRESQAPAISPGCTLLVRPIFSETTAPSGQMPSAAPGVLAQAILDCVEAGANILNLSVGLENASDSGQRDLEAALDLTARRGVLVIAAAGNQGSIGSSTITAHPWVIPVAACGDTGRPLSTSNFGQSIGLRGLLAPGSDINSLASDGEYLTLSGTSVAAPFVTGTLALLLSAFPRIRPTNAKVAVTFPAAARRRSVVPPLLDAWAAFRFLRGC